MSAAHYVLIGAALSAVVLFAVTLVTSLVSSATEYVAVCRGLLAGAALAILICAAALIAMLFVPVGGM